MIRFVKKCIGFILIISLLLAFSSCAVGEDSSNEDEQPYREYGSIKYDEKLGQAYQIVDYNIVDIAGDNAVVIEFFFVTDYSALKSNYELSLRSGGVISNDEDMKDVPYLGELYYSTLLGDGIVSAVGVHISDAILTEGFKNKLETDKNHKDMLKDDVYNIFRITEVYTDENNVNTVYIVGGTAIYELTTDLRIGIEENKFVVKLNYKHWD